jgi:exosortase D (VPLPA-CTERM-specific)
MVLACLALTYWPTLQRLAGQWLASEDYSHGILVAPVAAYLVWRRRKDLATASVRSDWRALTLMGLAIAVFIVGELGAELFTTRISLLVFLVGAVWFLYGPEVLRILRFPLAFLFLMLPLPGFVYRKITFPLQLVSSAWSVKVLQKVGVSAYREGNVIDLDFMMLQVVEACSGLRYILPLLTAGVLFAYFGQKVLWKRIALILATLPIAIVANVLRIAGTGYIGRHWGEEAAQGFFHSFSGWVVFMLSVGLFFLLDRLLKLIPEKARKARVRQASGSPSSPLPGPRWLTASVAAVLILAAAPVVGYLGEVPRVQLRKPLAEFPQDFQGFSGRRSTMDQEIWEKVGGQDYVIIEYRKPGESPIEFYVAYYEQQKKGGDFVHTPRLCLPGGGWFIEEDRMRRLGSISGPRGSGETLSLNELVITKDGHRQLVYFWYQGRGRNFTNEFAAKFYMVWDGLWRRRTDGALVRLVMPLGRDTPVQDARKSLDAFALSASRELTRHLP